MNTPVLLLVYNRPECTERVLNRLLECGVSRVYVSGDGPKNDRDQNRTDEVKACVSKFSEIVQRTSFEKTNRGCKQAVLNGINWFFSEVEEGIIIEDDCLPNQPFFKFASGQLNLYRNEPKVKMVSGNNPLGEWDCEKGHFMSRIGHIWGWATWKDKWDSFDPELPKLGDFIDDSGFQKAFGQTELASTRKRQTIEAAQGKIDTWDYQWNAHILMESGLATIPKFNLIENIGFGNGGTHLTEKPTWISNTAFDHSAEHTAIPLVPNREYEMELYLSQRANEPSNRSSEHYRKLGSSGSASISVAIINSTDIGGGAEKIAFNLHLRLLELDQDSKLLVQTKKSNLESVIEIETNWESQLESLKADVVHIHNLHGTSLDLHTLSAISKTTPVVFTLHDNWLCTGSVDHPFSTDPFSLSMLNLKAWKQNLNTRKEAVTNGEFRFTAPSQWMRDLFFKSHRVRSFYVPNAVAANLIKAVEPPSDRFILFVANRPETNPYKDYETLKTAWKKVNTELGPASVDLVCIGAKETRTETVGTGKLIHIQYTESEEILAQMKAALLVVQPSKMDNAPLTILEAHSVGKNVIGSFVGGLPEMLSDQEQSWLYEAGNSDDLARKIRLAINHVDKDSSTESTHYQTTVTEMTETYLGHYLELTSG